MPMEKEIAALKDKLTEAEDKIKELEASKVVKSCNPFAWSQSSTLMLWAKLEYWGSKNCNLDYVLSESCFL